MKFNTWFYYTFFLIIFLFLLILDEIAFILFNISFYKILCGLEMNNLLFRTILTNTELIYYYLHTDIYFLLIIDSHLFYYELIKTNMQMCFELNLVSNSLYYIIDYFYILLISRLVEFEWLVIKQIELQIGTSFLINYNHMLKESSIFILYFNTNTNNLENIVFYSLVNKIYIVPGENILLFFRIQNITNVAIQGIALYLISPIEYIPYVNKLQCFCFEEFIIYKNESLHLPVLLNIESSILTISNILTNREIIIEYLLLLN